MQFPYLSDEHYMAEAISLAREAAGEGEIPVGAVVVSQGRIIARAKNSTERLNDVTAHAEILSITAASEYLGGKYLNNCTLFVTLEPCLMCAGALYWSQIGRIVFGAPDEKRGYRRLKEPVLHPKTLVRAGVLEEECREVMLKFFARLRT